MCIENNMLLFSMSDSYSGPVFVMFSIVVLLPQVLHIAV